MPVMVLGAKREAGRVIVDRVIVGEACMAADAMLVVKLSTATPTKRNMRVVFIDNCTFLLIPHRDAAGSC